MKFKQIVWATYVGLYKHLVNLHGAHTETVEIAIWVSLFPLRLPHGHAEGLRKKKKEKSVNSGGTWRVSFVFLPSQINAPLTTSYGERPLCDCLELASILAK